MAAVKNQDLDFRLLNYPKMVRDRVLLELNLNHAWEGLLPRERLAERDDAKEFLNLLH